MFAVRLKVKVMPLLASKAFRVASITVVLLFIVAALLHLPKTHRVADLLSSPSPDRTVNRPAVQDPTSVDWSRFAYVQYATNPAYLCNAVMLFETLHRLGSRAQRLLMYPSKFAVDEHSREGKLLRRARDRYDVTLNPIEVQLKHSADPTWAESYTKLLAFNQTQYDRVLILDSDATVLQPMDELFFLPSCPLAIPRAYWLDFDNRTMSSQLMVIEPSEFEFNRVLKAIDEAGPSDYDMEIVNKLYKDSALILPHRPYDLLTGEFRKQEHSDYLGNDLESWNPDQILEEAKFLHFSDWPVPKPWLDASEVTIEQNQPACDRNSQTEQDDCHTRNLWLQFYADFKRRRQEVCDISD